MLLTLTRAHPDPARGSGALLSDAAVPRSRLAVRDGRDCSHGEPATVVLTVSRLLLPRAATLLRLTSRCESHQLSAVSIAKAIHDAKLFPKLGKPQLAGVVCTIMCTIGLIFVTRAGVHWLELFDGFAVNVTLFVVGALECIAIGWIYGVNQFAAVSARAPLPILGGGWGRLGLPSDATCSPSSLTITRRPLT